MWGGVTTQPLLPNCSAQTGVLPERVPAALPSALGIVVQLCWGRHGTAVFPHQHCYQGRIPETARWPRKRIQESSVKCAGLAPLQIKPPQAGSWQIISALQTLALAASDQIQTNLPCPCCVCDQLGCSLRVPLARSAGSHSQNNAAQLVRPREASLELICTDYRPSSLISQEFLV